MSVPWLELITLHEPEEIPGPGFSEYPWQALFACQIGIPKHQDWVNFKWGFNAEALFGEAMNRQNLFFESQYGVNNELRIEHPIRRTLALRYINFPDKGLLLTALGKVYGKSRDSVEESALAYCRELKATFPYEYTLSPANSKEEFRRISGWHLLAEDVKGLNIAQIKRYEMPLLINQKSPFLQGRWQSDARAHEQIWRSLGAYTYPVLVNITLRSTVIYDNELPFLLSNADQVAKFQSPLINQQTLTSYQEWSENYVNRRLSPWQKFFYLQVHLASNREIDEEMIRSVGTVLTSNSKGAVSPGYQVRFPVQDERAEWARRLQNLDIIFSSSYLPVPRWSEIADLQEMFAVMRIPYSPPDNGFPDLKFIETKAE